MKISEGMKYELGLEVEVIKWKCKGGQISSEKESGDKGGKW